MGVAALLAPVPIPFAIFSQPWLGSFDVDGAFRALAEVSLITTGEDDYGTFTVHRLVQTIMRERLAELGLTASYADLGLVMLSVGVPHDTDQAANGETLKALAPHALALLRFEHAEERGQRNAASLSSRIGKYFLQVARYAEARPLLQDAVAYAETVHGPDHPDTAIALANLARLLKCQGDLAAARLLTERVLAMTETLRGPDHPHTAAALDDLALVLSDQGDPAAARPLCERAMAITEKVLGPEHPSTALGLNNLAALLTRQGDRAAARPLYERALAIQEKVRGLEHPDTAHSLNNLAVLLHDQGDLAAARTLHERALAVREKLLGPEHPDTQRASATLPASSMTKASWRPHGRSTTRR
jgi:tetratricopeptide (TPR) repeat protein